MRVRDRMGLLAAAAAWSLLIGCASHEEAGVGSKPGEARFELALAPGPAYRTTTRWLIFEIPVYPQVAAWVETPSGGYLGTIYVTEKAARRSWVSAPGAGRPEALPVWSHLAAGGIDAVAAATASGETRRGSDLASGLPPGDYVIKLETNRSYDYNAAYTPADSGVCGQPSVVYRAQLRVGAGAAEAVFAPVGTGAPDGAHGRIHPGLEGIDSALELFSSLRVAVR